MRSVTRGPSAVVEKGGPSPNPDGLRALEGSGQGDVAADPVEAPSVASLGLPRPDQPGAASMIEPDSERVDRRADELFHEAWAAIARGNDRLFTWLLVLPVAGGDRRVAGDPVALA